MCPFQQQTRSRNKTSGKKLLPETAKPVPEIGLAETEVCSNQATLGRLVQRGENPQKLPQCFKNSQELSKKNYSGQNVSKAD